jgi:hypothetical protein
VDVHELTPVQSGEELTTAEVVSDLDSCSAIANRAQRDLFRAIVRCDLRRVWRDDDCRDIAHWVALRLGITNYKARRWVACAWALERYPLIDAAFQDGALSVDKVVELTRLADALDEPETKLLSWALRVSVASIRERADEARRIADDVVRDAYRERSLTWWWDMDRTRMNLSGSLPADMGIRITAALDRIAAALPVSPVDGDGEDESTMDARRADALEVLAGHSLANDSDADRATVVVHAPMETVTEGERNGVSSTGVALHPEIVRRLACDARIQVVGHRGDGAVVGIGATSRVIPRWLRRAIERRDGFRCTFPNCGSRLGLDCHHVVSWPHGPTDADNLTLLCRTHHRLVHEHGWHVNLADDQSTRWFRPNWTPYVPRPPALAEDAFATDERDGRAA